MKNHKEEREKIENDTWESIEAIKDKNKEELAKKIDEGMQAKCTLTLVMNNFKDKKADKEKKEEEIKNKSDALKKL
jgi:hypothetical protein